VAHLRRWAAQTDTGDRDELVPGPSERAWAQVSVGARECLGASRCPYGGECFAERAREQAAGADLVVTNHALLAIDAIEGLRVLPEHQAVIVDEAHELAARVTGVATQELSAGLVDRAARRARPHLGGPADAAPAADPADLLAEAGAALEEALSSVPDGRLRHLPEDLAAAVRLVRDAAHTVLTATGGDRDRGDLDAEAARRQAQALVEEVHAVASRLAERSEHDVAWRLTRERGGPAIRVAPLSVAGLLRERLFGRRTVVLTSATLALGGGFGPVAARVGLVGPAGGGTAGEPAGRPGEEPAGGPGDEPRWTGLDVGSPFDHRRQGVLYVARHLPPPGRDGLAAAVIDELADLVAAAGGRTLGLFSSRRAAGEAAAALRARLDVPVLLQGEDATAELVRRFAADARTCLFGTLSLWQGVDVPGSACQLVVIDRLPFPRPDDPLASAQQEAVNRAGGNGFLAVAASHAALLLAQGAGRLLRTAQDRGVVAVLDPRLDTARYAGFLRASLPPLWYTTDPAQVRRSLAAIDATAPAPLPVPPRPATPDAVTSFDVGGLGDLVAS
ncbi:MAG: ATP-dependent DNA helicase, partial [Actinomycetota bacterium]